MRVLTNFLILCALIYHGEFADTDNVDLEETKIVEPSNEITPSAETIQSVDLKTQEAEPVDVYEISSNTTQPSGNETKPIILCTLNSTANEKREVEITNSTRLLEILTPNPDVTNKETEAQCTVVMFYSRLCSFSAAAAPHFNSLARSFPDIKLAALDALTHHGFNTQYGIVGVPTLIIFHNGRPVAKFNGTEYTIHSFVKFVTLYTGIKEEVIAVHSQDFQGPVPSVTDKEIDYFLVLSWVFVIVCALFFFSKSALCKVITEKVKNIWTEAEAQHVHID